MTDRCRLFFASREREAPRRPGSLAPLPIHCRAIHARLTQNTTSTCYATYYYFTHKRIIIRWPYVRVPSYIFIQNLFNILFWWLLQQLLFSLIFFFFVNYYEQLVMNNRFVYSSIVITSILSLRVIIIWEHLMAFRHQHPQQVEIDFSNLSQRQVYTVHHKQALFSSSNDYLEKRAHNDCAQIYKLACAGY